MHRRSVLRLLGSVPLALVMRQPARPQGRLPVVAAPLIAAGPEDRLIVELRKGLAEHACIDGKSIPILYPSTCGTLNGLPAVLRELVEHKVDAIVAGVHPIVAAAKDGTGTIPIILVGWDSHPVAAGFVPPVPPGALSGSRCSSARAASAGI